MTQYAEITTHRILQALRDHSVEAQLIGDHRSAERFCSLRAPEERGVFYVSSGANVNIAIKDSIVLCDTIPETVDPISNSFIVTTNPQRAFYILQHLYYQPLKRFGIHETSIIDDAATIDTSAYVGPYCIVEHASIAADCVLTSHIVIFDDVALGRAVRIEPHTTLGATGVAWVWDDDDKHKIVQPQTGGVCVGDETFIGTDVTIARGSVNEVTIIGEKCLISHGTKIGHSCKVGALVHFANNVTVAGGVTIGDESFLGSGCVLRPHVVLPRGTIVGAGAVVVQAPEQEFATIAGVPAKVVTSNKVKITGVPRRGRP